MKRVHQREADLWEPRIHMSCLSILELPRAGSSAPITPSAIWKTKAAAHSFGHMCDQSQVGGKK